MRGLGFKRLGFKYGPVIWASGLLRGIPRVTFCLGIYNIKLGAWSLGELMAQELRIIGFRVSGLGF